MTSGNDEEEYYVIYWSPKWFLTINIDRTNQIYKDYCDENGIKTLTQSYK